MGYAGFFCREWDKIDWAMYDGQSRGEETVFCVLEKRFERSFFTFAQEGKRKVAGWQLRCVMGKGEKGIMRMHQNYRFNKKTLMV